MGSISVHRWDVEGPAMNATAIVHIVHGRAHYRPVVRHPAFVANRSATGGGGGGETSVGGYGRF